MSNKSLSAVVCLLSSHLASLATCFAILLAAAPLFADVPVSINVAGAIEGVTHADVATPADAKVMSMVFRLYAEPGTGRVADKKSALWGRQTAVSLENGEFDVDLEDGLGSKVADAAYDTLAEAVGAVLDRKTSVFYLGITPENDSNAEIFPRQRITAVPKAVQAGVVRTIPENFTATGGVFTAESVEVANAVTLAGNVTYATADFATGKTVTFDTGLHVTGTVTAGAISASIVYGKFVETDTLTASAATPLFVTGLVTSAGAPRWDGNLGTDVVAGPTVTVSVVRGNVEADQVGEANELVLSDFVNDAGNGFDSSAASDWNILGDWVTISDTSPYEGVDHSQIDSWDEMTAQYVLREAVTGGRWQAPCDCLAYFQAHVESANPEYGSFVQFYILDNANDSNFSARTPNAIVSLRNGGKAQPKLDTVAPLLLCKGQYVKWLGYNPDQNPESTIPEVKHSHVSAIVYRPFNWR